MLSLRSWPGVMVHMLWHYTHETVLTGGQRYISIMSLYKCIYSREYPGLSLSVPGGALWCPCFSITHTGLSLLETGENLPPLLFPIVIITCNRIS